MRGLWGRGLIFRCVLVFSVVGDYSRIVSENLNSDVMPGYSKQHRPVEIGFLLPL